MERGVLRDRSKAGWLRALWFGALLSLVLLVAGCGGGSTGPAAGGGIGGSGTGDHVAGGGIGGTGTGTVTAVDTGYRAMDSSESGDAGSASGGVASIQLNGTRTFAVTADTLFLIDGEPVTSETFLSKGKGLVARVDVATDVNADFTSGTALRVEGRHLLRGPVTSVAPLRVMGQEVITSSSTVLGGGLAGDSGGAGATPDWQSQLAALFKAGPVYVAVSGYLSGPGQVQATRLSLLARKPAEWKLTGQVASSVNNTIAIGEQTVLLVNGTGNCGPTVESGSFVDVRVVPDFNYLLSITDGEPGMLSASSVTCISTALQVPDGVNTNRLAVGMEGFVSDTTAGDGYTFLLDGQPVLITEATAYRSGSVDGIRVGARVQVDGFLDLATGVLTANAVAFFGGEVLIEAPVSESTTELLRMIGLSVWRTPSTDGDLDLFGSSPSDRLVRVEGVQGLGSVVYAGEVRKTPYVGYGTVSVQAPVEFVWSWHQGKFNMLGLTVDAWGAYFRGPDGQVLSRDQFFSLLKPGMQVRVSSARYHAPSRSLYDAFQISIRPDGDDSSAWSDWNTGTSYWSY